MRPHQLDDARPGPPVPAPAPWHSASPAYQPASRRTSSVEGGQHHHLYAAAPPPLKLSRLGSGCGGGGGLHWASTPGGRASGAAATPPPPPSPPPGSTAPVTAADVWAALACATTAGCADPALGGVADAPDGAGGLRVAPALPFLSTSAAATAPATTTPPALLHLAHPDSVEAPAWLERLVGCGEASTSGTVTTTLKTPAVVVGCRGAWLAVPPPALAHWECGPFTPAGGPQAVSYVALVPRGREAWADARLASVSAAWAAAGLGTHALAGSSAPGADARGIISYDGEGGVAALARAYAALHLALARARPPVRWPGVVVEEEGGGGHDLLAGASPDGSLVVYVVPPPPPPPPPPPSSSGGGGSNALAALVACARAPTAPPPSAPPQQQLSRLHRSSDGHRRLSSDTGTRDSTPDWFGTPAARDTYKRESGTGSASGSPAAAGGGGGGGPVAVPCTLQVLPGGEDEEDDLTGRAARTLAFCVFNKVAAAGKTLAHSPLAALRFPAGPSPALHCAFAVVPQQPPAGGGTGDTALLALAFTDGTGELAPGPRVVRVVGQASSAVPAAVLAAADEVFSRAVGCATRDDARPARIVITRLGAPPSTEAAAWEAALGGRGHHHPPTTVLALSADPPFRLAGLGVSRLGPSVTVSSDRACIVWAQEDGAAVAETVRAAVLARVAPAGGVDLGAAAAELHALGCLGEAVEAAAVSGGGCGSVHAHLPGHCATALRLARLVAAAAGRAV